MRRKLIKQGKGALTLSLPSGWIKEQELRPGDEINIEENEDGITLKTESKPQPKKKEINVGYMSPEAYRSLLGSLYRGGYDIIEVKFTNKRVIPNLEKAVNSIYGFEVFYTSETGCTVRTIYNDEETDIKLHIDRMVYTIHTMQQLIMDDLKKENKASSDELMQLRNNVLKQRDLIIRIIKKKRLLSNDIFPYYTISLSLWGVARNYHHMYMDLDTGHDTEIVQKTNEFFRMFFKKMHSLSMEEYLGHHERYKKIYKECTTQTRKNPLAAYCMSIILQIQLSDSSIYLLNHG
ncbi:MAG: AbrB/MazE/SpoVT family DNA-binding domain-containing protein [Candidatus Woesearchaeota archaeon]